MIDCPLCKAPLNVEEDELDEGEVVACDECGATLVIANLDPIEIEVAEEEDLGDPDEEFDDDDEDENDPWRIARGY